MQYFEKRLRSAKYRQAYQGVTVKVPLAWLMQNITESCDFGSMESFESWNEMMVDKASDTGFGHLVESIMKRGFMRAGSIGFWYENGIGEITEGHHRLVAAILLGLDHVYVSASGNDHYNNHKLPNVCAHWDDDQYPIEVEYA